MIPVIMAGGTGSRLWPLSRMLYPKQFMALEGEESLLQNTLKRLHGMNCSPAIVISNEEHRFIVAEQLRLIGEKAGPLILEPVGRSTAPAAALAAIEALSQEEDPVLLIMAADHVIKDVPAFQKTVVEALKIAEMDKLVTFGIVPTEAETGYGYIRAKGLTSTLNSADEPAYPVDEFVEKPDLETARLYLDSGDYFWNSGMFMFKARRYLEELEIHSPEILRACRAAMKHTSKDLEFYRVDRAQFEDCPSDSIDYAVMEKTRDAYVVPLNVQWNDIGSWSALWDIAEKDENNNVLKGDILLNEVRNCYINTTGKLVAAVGLEDIVVVNTPDAVLVATKDKVQNVKEIVETLKKQGRTEHYNHREVYRPWGKYDSVDTGDRYQVKRITVKPGAKLSQQMHHHRAEHWVVVSGTARIEKGDDTILLTENQSIYIPLGTTHSLENPGKIPLELIEVQSGSYLGEDDIIRFGDVYGRV
ncbi:mannose-1-phosphate guanylyltransferase/mannose-6-phosphate isomerase [Desulfopila inferna]|uniref:mannose-1-phosphate guanylyltransferase/mannose-6-phosphate isomerase n=1 Tax=Desulfopila inferna TaxID=468528 RepID=UPI001965CDE4|nr:mannose-1-phosphate guanylyltransferase/mannose-6-phosphate isomerase [Desulfopila inferna]MBM9604014.1 mannose-1-phosphate guanylyltransferase/mannose-6-phosphate isomerase [Desulfopila inferna]